MNEPTPEFREKARRHLFDTELRRFPVVLEMYARSFKIDADLDKIMNKIVHFIRTSPDYKQAYTLVCHYLDALEEGHKP